MNVTTLLPVSIALLLWFLRVHAAEDHSAHVPATEDEHAHHRQPALAPADDPHAHHQPAPQVDEHAAHRMPHSDSPTESERAHVPPAPPSLVLGNMSTERMIELMQMEDDAAIGSINIDELEAFDSQDAHGVAWELQGWYGTDYNKLWIEAEGERVDGSTDMRVEVLWDRIVSPWWSVQAGVRHDVQEGPSRTWAAFGVQGTAPYFVEIDATVYAAEEGRSALRFGASQEWLITQRLIIEPELELTGFGKADVENRIGSGLSELNIGLRMRYEFLRELAPYLGVEWERKLGNTADLIRADDSDPSELRFVVGMRAWF